MASYSSHGHTRRETHHADATVAMKGGNICCPPIIYMTMTTDVTGDCTTLAEYLAIPSRATDAAGAEGS